MSDRLTADQIETARAAWCPLFSAKEAEDRLLDLLDAGTTVTFPEPAYEVVRYTIGGLDGWAVRDDEHRVKAWYGDDLLGAEKDARELCHRLNREVQP